MNVHWQYHGGLFEPSSHEINQFVNTYFDFRLLTNDDNPDQSLRVLEMDPEFNPDDGMSDDAFTMALDQQLTTIQEVNKMDF